MPAHVGRSPHPVNPTPLTNSVATVRPSQSNEPVNLAAPQSLTGSPSGRYDQGNRQLADLYAPVAAELALVEQRLRTELRNEQPRVDDIVGHSFRLGGKRLRPALVLLSGRALGHLTEDHLLLGTVVELIHTATLLHDDVLDEAETRRHLPTVNARWGNEASILSGDYLFSHAFYLAATLESTWACQVIGKATNTVCEGELLQVGHRGDFDLAEEDYLRIIHGKTASLCACSCQLGAHYAGASASVVEDFESFGRDLGMAFQIADDLLDVLGDEQTAGKSLGTDLDKQKLTLPWIRLLAQSGASRDRIRGLLASSQPSDRRTLLAELRQSDGLQYARQMAAGYAQRAHEALQGIAENPAGDVLRLLTKFVIQRSH